MQGGETELLLEIAKLGGGPRRDASGMGGLSDFLEESAGRRTCALTAPRLLAKLLVAGSMLATTGCADDKGQGANQVESARMGGEDKPWWHDMVEQQKAQARQRITKLMETAKTYPRPPADPDIYWTSKAGRIAMVDRKTGDYLLSYGSDREKLTASFIYMTKDGQRVCAFNTQWSGGFRMEWPSEPILVYATIEADNQTDEVRAARKRISIERFAEFMTAYPDFANNPERQFVVIDAPRKSGESQ